MVGCNTDLVRGGSVKETETNGVQPRRNHISWSKYFMSVAQLAAQRSKDPSTQVGACIVNQQNRIVATGYNGMPNGVQDDMVPWSKEGPFLETKYAYVVHAELNAILNSVLTDLRGCRVYVSLFPCNECAKAIIQSGIKHIIYSSDKHQDKESTKAAKIMLRMAGVLFEEERDESDRIDEDNRPINILLQALSLVECDKDLVRSQETEINGTKPRSKHISWSKFFMSVAQLAAQRSKDPSTQVGACIVNQQNKIVATGYNGMPNGVQDDMVPWSKEGPFLETKYAYVVHAELNAILNSVLTDLRGCRVYVSLFPCNECAKAIIQSGIKHIIYLSDKHQDKESTKAAKIMFRMADVLFEQYSSQFQ